MIGWNQVSKSWFVIIFHHFSVQTRTLSHPNIQTPTWDKHGHQKTHRRRQAHLICGRKLSSPLISNLSFKTSLEFHFFFLTIFWVLRANQTQIVQSPTQICSSFVLRCCSSLLDRWFLFRSVLRRQIIGSSSVLLLFKYQNLVLETRFCFLELES